MVDPPDSLTIVDGARAITLGVWVRTDQRIDPWSEHVNVALHELGSQLQRGVSLDVVFEQYQYVETRLQDLAFNLLLLTFALIMSQGEHREPGK